MERGRDGVPRLPLVEPDRAAAAPLALSLDERYLYRLEGVSPQTRHQVMAGGAMGFYGLN